MPQLPFGRRTCLVIVAVWLLGGLAIGLFVGWMVWPVQVTNVDVTDLKSTSQDDYIILTASSYAYDLDLSKAQTRLATLKDPKIADRLVVLAKSLASAQNKTDAGYVASLAIALGKQDSALALLAATATPTVTPPTATFTPIPTGTRVIPPSPTFIPSPTNRPTIAATATITPTRTSTPRPRATNTPPPPPPAAIAATQWIPGFPGEWPPGTSYQSASVAPGQKYWHLTKALYCDDRDERNDCPNLPGGSTGTAIYVMLLGQGGWRESAPLKVTKDDGSLATVDDLGPEKPASDMCNCNYSFMANHWPIQVGGQYPSDTIRGMGLYSVRMKLPQAHTRYFLTFQLVTR